MGGRQGQTNGIADGQDGQGSGGEVATTQQGMIIYHHYPSNWALLSFSILLDINDRNEPPILLAKNHYCLCA